jgi:hypothetical protein
MPSIRRRVGALFRLMDLLLPIITSASMAAPGRMNRHRADISIPALMYRVSDAGRGRAGRVRLAGVRKPSRNEPAVGNARPGEGALAMGIWLTRDLRDVGRAQL